MLGGLFYVFGIAKSAFLPYFPNEKANLVSFLYKVSKAFESQYPEDGEMLSSAQMQLISVPQAIAGKQTPPLDRRD